MELDYWNGLTYACGGAYHPHYFFSFSLASGSMMLLVFIVLTRVNQWVDSRVKTEMQQPAWEKASFPNISNHIIACISIPIKTGEDSNYVKRNEVGPKFLTAKNWNKAMCEIFTGCAYTVLQRVDSDSTIKRKSLKTTGILS